MSKNIKEICCETFGNCKSLEEITIPEGVKYIYSDAFTGCENLKNIILPSTIERIDNSFDKCTNLDKVVIKDWKILLKKDVKLFLNKKLKYCYLSTQFKTGNY